MKIGITGGSGFIGSHVAESLKKQHDVSIFDLNEPKTEGVEFVKGDILDLESVKKSLKNCEVVIHLAAFLGVGRSESDPITTLDFNISGTRNVIEAAKENNVKKIIFSSSSEVYGEPVAVPISESNTPMPITTYGISKLAGEEYVKSYGKMYGIEYTIVRLFNVYGFGQSDQFVIPEFIKSALTGETLKIHGSGSQIRSFCHVSDVCNAMNLILKEGNGQIFNIGNNIEPISIKILADKIVSLSKSNSKIEAIPFTEAHRGRNVEILHRIPDISKAGKILSYQPAISLEEGLKEIIEKTNH